MVKTDFFPSYLHVGKIMKVINNGRVICLENMVGRNIPLSFRSASLNAL